MSSASNHDDGEPSRSNVAAQKIEQAQYRCHEARSQYREARLRYGPGGVSHAIEVELHLAVMNYYDALRTVRDKGELRDFWTSVRLWPTGPQTTLALHCQHCENWFPNSDDHQPAADCPECGDGLLELEEAVVYDDQGNPQYNWVRGFDALKQHELRTERYTATRRTFFGETTVTGERAATLDPDKLLRVSRKLDEAAEKTGYGPPVREKTPEGEADMQDLAALLKTRGQDEALDNIPTGGDD